MKRQCLVKLPTRRVDCFNAARVSLSQGTSVEILLDVRHFGENPFDRILGYNGHAELNAREHDIRRA